MPDQLNRRRSKLFHELVSLQLQQHGLRATVTPRPRNLAELGIALGEDSYTRSAISGLDGWCIKVNSSLKFELSAGLDAVQRDAASDGARFAAVIGYRRERAASEQYAVLTLDTLAALIAATTPTEAHMAP